MHIDTIGHGPDLVLIHGWAMHGGIFAPLVERLSPQFQLHIVDLPGHGHSRDDATCYHCGLPVPASAGGKWTVRIDDTVHAMCCPGCAAVAQATGSATAAAASRVAAAVGATGGNSAAPVALGGNPSPSLRPTSTISE